jgi:hypothetical protein
MDTDTAKIAMDARPGGPTAKRQPSPEGLGNQIKDDSERRRRDTKPIFRPGVIRRPVSFYERPSRKTKAK